MVALSKLLGPPMVPTALPLRSESIHSRLPDIGLFLDNDIIANERRLGHRFEWDTVTGFGDSYTAGFTITGPGVMQFMAVWIDSGTDIDDCDFRVLIDGNEVCEQLLAWTSGQIEDGFILVGQMIPAASGGTPEYGGVTFEDLIFNDSFEIQFKNQAGGGTYGNTIKAAYRRYST